MHRMNRLVATALLLTVLTFGGTAIAQVPQTLNYQGYLTDSSGAAQLDPEVVEFSIYAAETGGAPLWSEFQSVFPDQGLFSTTLGNAGNPFPPGLFNTPLFLGVKVGTDAEMTPRTALSSTAFSMKALDTETLQGMTSADLDQSSEVAALDSDLTSGLASIQSQVTQVASDLTSAESTLSSVQGDLDTVTSDVVIVTSDLATAESDITSIESDLVLKQNRVNGTCASGSAIRTVSSAGTVTCEVDDSGPWAVSSVTSYLPAGQRVGLGTTAAAAVIQIDAPVDVDPFRARVQSSTKLRVHTNGSVSVGTSSAGTENGLTVNGNSGFGTIAPGARVTSTDANWQLQLDNTDVGGDDWWLGSSATAWAVGAGKFVLSNTNNSSSAAFVIDAAENVGISSVSPTAKLQVGTGSDVSASNGTGYFMMGTATGTNIAMDNNEIMARSNGAVTTLSLNAEGGEVRINTGGTRDSDALEVRGRTLFDNGGNGGMRITATDSSPTNALLESTQFEEGLLGFSGRPFWRVYSREFYAQSSLEYRTYSDRSLKSNIAPIKSAIDTIKALEGVSYKLSTSPMGKRKRGLTAEEQFVNDNQLGFIAQDVAKVLPQLVTEDTDSGLKTVAYMGVIPVLVEALKEQQLQLEAQRAELDELKALLQ